MKLDLKIRCSLSFDRRMREQEVPRTLVIDTQQFEGPDVQEWGDGDGYSEYAQVVPHPFEQLEEGHILIVARGVSVELEIDELRAALAALDAVKGVL